VTNLSPLRRKGLKTFWRDCVKRRRTQLRDLEASRVAILDDLAEMRPVISEQELNSEIFVEWSKLFTLMVEQSSVIDEAAKKLEHAEKMLAFFK
jgi:hypothetical protein